MTRRSERCYQTQYTDPTTGDVLAQSRWYSPGTGTFRSRDTWAGDLNTPVTLNRYTYANNNPIKYWDPSGFCSQMLWDTCLDTIATTGRPADIGTRRIDAPRNPVEARISAALETIRSFFGGDSSTEGSVTTAGQAAAIATTAPLAIPSAQPAPVVTGTPLQAGSTALRLDVATPSAQMERLLQLADSVPGSSAPTPHNVAYDDSNGTCTIGYGSVIDKSGLQGCAAIGATGRQLQPGEADTLFERDVKQQTALLIGQLGGGFLVEQQEYDALLSLSFNAGAPGPSLTAALQRGPTLNDLLEELDNGLPAAPLIDLRWTSGPLSDANCPAADGAGICIRRAKEIELFWFGRYPTDLRVN